jgi:hypothetical protein
MVAKMRCASCELFPRPAATITITLHVHLSEQQVGGQHVKRSNRALMWGEGRANRRPDCLRGGLLELREHFGHRQAQVGVLVPAAGEDGLKGLEGGREVHRRAAVLVDDSMDDPHAGVLGEGYVAVGDRVPAVG